MRCTLAVVVTLTACAVLAGATSLPAVGEWVTDAPPHRPQDRQDHHRDHLRSHRPDRRTGHSRPARATDPEPLEDRGPASRP
ncbi:transposase family protein (plasmid) [Kitasatospora sp. NBC_01300]|nr:transposase family protein [Kitasatospora sp. NBC_01300]